MTSPKRYGVNRKTILRWLVRYANEGLESLADRSCKPARCPHQITPEIEAKILELRRQHPAWGPRTILSKLRRETEAPPSRSAIYRCLVRHHLIDPKPRRRRPQDYKRWERSRAMELWQIDVMGGVRLTDATQLSVVTGIDDHSRFCVIAKLVPRATAKPICDELVEGLSRHGIPEQILTHNAKVITGKLHKKPANVLFDRICLNKRHKTRPDRPLFTDYHRQDRTTAQDDEKGVFLLNCCATIAQAQAALDDWVRRRYAFPAQSILGQPGYADSRRLTERRLAIRASTAEEHRHER